MRILIRFSKLSKAACVAIISLKNPVGFIITLQGFLFFLPREMNPNSYLETETLRERMPVYITSPIDVYNSESSKILKSSSLYNITNVNCAL